MRTFGKLGPAGPTGAAGGTFGGAATEDDTGHSPRKEATGPLLGPSQQGELCDDVCGRQARPLPPVAPSPAIISKSAESLDPISITFLALPSRRRQLGDQRAVQPLSAQQCDLARVVQGPVLPQDPHVVRRLVVPGPALLGISGSGAR